MTVTHATPRTHPVYLTTVIFPDFSFKRNHNPKKPLQFPQIDIAGHHFIDDEDKKLYLRLNVESAKNQRSAALKIKISCVASYECSDTERLDEILEAFTSLDTPYILLWPYIREFVARMTHELGFPPFHLPLTMGWKLVNNGAISSFKEVRDFKIEGPR
jgi:preprotein translocase subunit SecB